MILIVGLGNPGEKYKATRHNIGFMAVDRLVEEIAEGEEITWQEYKKFKGESVKVKNDLLIVKPKTYMNLSGQCISHFVNFYKIGVTNLWVVHDDIDLPLGRIRIRIDGGSGGHKGVESIVKRLGTNHFIRLRLGIGRGLYDPEQYVLSPFLPEEKKAVDQLIENAVEALILTIEKGLEKAMNEYN